MNYNEDELKNRIYNTNFKYNGLLNLPKNIMFGTELEFTDSYYENVLEKLNLYNKKGKLHEYVLGDEASVQQFDFKIGKKTGGEIKTPKLKDNVSTWKDIKLLCTILRECGSTTNINCGGHIHFDINIFDNNYKYFINFFKLWAIFEDIIFMFGCGTNDRLRNNINRHTKEIGNDIYYLFNSIIKHPNNEIYNILKNSLKDKNRALRFTKFNTLEIRVPNGTIQEMIIQNNILFFSKLILYATSKNYDNRLIDNLLYNHNPNKMVIETYKNINIDKAIILANLIYDNEIDKLDFLKQYLKLFNKKDQKVLTK